MNKKKRLSHTETISIAERAHRRAAGMSLGDVNINILIRQNYLLLVENLNHELAPFGLSHVAYFAMMMLRATADNQANPSELCLMTGETRANMTRICDELVAKGWMDRVTSSEDRRRVDLSLTAEGMALLQKVVPHVRERNQAVLSEFDEAEKSMLVNLLTRLNASFEKKA